MSGYFEERFGNWLPEDCESILVSECPYCGEEFYEGDDVLVFEDELYCNAFCLAEHLGAYKGEAILERNE